MTAVGIAEGRQVQDAIAVEISGDNILGNRRPELPAVPKRAVTISQVNRDRKLIISPGFEGNIQYSIPIEITHNNPSRKFCGKSLGILISRRSRAGRKVGVSIAKVHRKIRYLCPGRILTFVVYDVQLPIPVKVSKREHRRCRVLQVGVERGEGPVPECSIAIVQQGSEGTVY